MSDPRLGNSSSELGQFESGGNLAGVNSSGLAMSGPVLEVDFAREDNEIVIRQRSEKHNRSLELVHSELDILSHQMMEDPEMTSFSVPQVGTVEASPSRLSRAMTRNANREELIWFGIDSQNMTAAMGDRIVVRRDALESEYVCRSCRGKGHTDETCKLCDGKQQKEGITCKSCLVLGFESEKPHPAGFTLCKDCRGSGWRNGVIIPEVAQGKPVTGVVVSLGPETKLVKLGDRVLHSKFAGHTLEMKAETYTFMREGEVISLLRDMA